MHPGTPLTACVFELRPHMYGYDDSAYIFNIHTLQSILKQSLSIKLINSIIFSLFNFIFHQLLHWPYLIELTTDFFLTAWFFFKKFIFFLPIREAFHVISWIPAWYYPSQTFSSRSCRLPCPYWERLCFRVQPSRLLRCLTATVTGQTIFASFPR